jgi:diketogulonate reductase-like aldo/keto reductase
MEKLVGNRLRAIGVSNFDIQHLEKLATTAKIPPAVNQVELHPYLPQQELVDYCQKHDILGENNKIKIKIKTNSSYS